MREHGEFPPDRKTSVYLILLSLFVALAVGFGVSFLGAGWFLGLLAGLVSLLLVQILVGRRLRKKLEPALTQVRRQVEAGHVRPAMETLRSLLPLGRWVPLLTGQLHAQMGVLAFHSNDRDRALEYLGKSSRRAAEAQLLLAAIQDRAGDTDAALATLQRAAPYQKKSDFFHNVWAYLLHKHGKTGEAIAVLHKFVDKRGGEASKDNLLRLQNDRKLNMKPFGLPWFALGYERPPASMGQMQTARKGFRQPPRSPKKR